MAAPAMYGCCSIDCREKKKIRNKTVEPKSYSLNCIFCNKNFITEKFNLKLCSKECKKNNKAKKNKLHRIENVETYRLNAKNKYHGNPDIKLKAIERSKKQRESGYHKKQQQKKRLEDPNWKSKQHKKTRAKAKGMTVEQYEEHCLSLRRTEEEIALSNIASSRLSHSAHFFAWHKHIGMSSHVDLYIAKNNAEYALKKWYEKVSTPEGLMWSRMKTRLRQVVKRAMVDDGARSVTLSKIGYTPKDLLNRLLSTLPFDASMDDFMNGRLHIDHIRPCASFDLSDSDQVKEAYALSNLQLLWAEDNWSKNSFWEGVTIRKNRSTIGFNNEEIDWSLMDKDWFLPSMDKK